MKRGMVALVAVTVALYAPATTAFSPSDLPSLCAWPYVANGGRFTAETVRIAQRILGYALNLNVTVDGKYDATTELLVKKFQQSMKLTVDGVIGPATWPVLMQAATPTLPNSVGLKVSAVQDALNANGFPVPINGNFDETTTKAVSELQVARGSAVTNGEVDDQVGAAHSVGAWDRMRSPGVQ